MIRAACLLFCGASVFAGGSPETTLVVVNGRSPVSRLVAHEYARMRAIPLRNLLVLDGVPHVGVIPLDRFLERIWTPVSRFLEAEGLADAIDLITYSADFPYAVDFKALLKGTTNPKMGGGQASLTGLTYLIRQVLDEREFWSLQTNRYFGLRAPGQTRPLDAAERALWAEAQAAIQREDYAAARGHYRAILDTHGRHPVVWYNLACCLARTGRADEALAALDRAAGLGYRRAPQTEADGDLASLRGRRRFKAIVDRMRRGEVRIDVRRARGFRARHAWTEDGETEERPGSIHRYRLSTQLAYTGRYGNSVPEVLAYLRAAAEADATAPDGTVYILENKDVRSRARAPFFASAMERLKELGRKVERLDGVLPPNKPDVLGAVVGKAGFSWAKSKSRILPGAICEHLTSFGAHFGTPGQTKCTEFLRFGAAGSSGTVMEPFALFQKFPVPHIHAFYAEGCSLAEAFFQSVQGPYQLMVIGDGLARPFARFEPVATDLPDGPWRGRIEVDAEVWVDGRPVAALDTAAFDDGHHDVRLVTTAADPVATRSVLRVDAVFANHGHGASARHESGGLVRVDAKGATGFELWHGPRVVARSDDGRLAYDPAALGPGPVELVARAVFGEGPGYRCAPMVVDLPAPPAAAPVEAHGLLRPGLSGHWTDGEGGRHPIAVAHVGDARGGRRLRDVLSVKNARAVVLEGLARVPQAGLYQLAVAGAGTVSVDFGGPRCRDLALDGQAFLAARYAAGWHRFRIELAPRGRPHVEVLLGGAVVLGDLELAHDAGPIETVLKASDPALVDSVRDAKGVTAGQFLVTLMKTRTGLASVTVYPGKDARDFPREWVVETNTGLGKYKPVKSLQTVVARPRRAVKDQPEIPEFLELRFEPVRARKIRLKPRGGASVAEIEVRRKR